MVPRGGLSSPIGGRLPLGKFLLDECHVTLLVVKSLFRADSQMADPLQVDSWRETPDGQTPGEQTLMRRAP